MPRIIYVNGRYVDRHVAAIHAEDRGYLFADGVYDAFELRRGVIIDLQRHMDRLFRSMSEIDMSNQPTKQTMEHIVKETVRLNRYHNGFVYLQVTRGVASRDFAFPSPDTPLSIICMVYNSLSGAMDQLARSGVKVITCRDIRWKRPDIKSILLLPSVLARQAARRQQAFEAWMLDDQGFITEGAASNAWIISKDNELITRPRDHAILGGITRQAVFELVEQENLALLERPFTLEEALDAKEAFITACSITVMPVVKIDGAAIGNGKVGMLTTRLRQLYQNRIETPV